MEERVVSSGVEDDVVALIAPNPHVRRGGVMRNSLCFPFSLPNVCRCEDIVPLLPVRLEKATPDLTVRPKDLSLSLPMSKQHMGHK